MAVIYDMSRIDAMEGHEFERFIADLLRKLGYQKVEVTPGSGDQGVDVLAEKDGVRYAIQCKCYSADLGNTPVQEVNTGKMIYHCHVGVVVTNRYFTQGARDAAKATGVLLWDRSKLESLIAQVQTTSGEEPAVRQSGETFTLWTGSPLLRRGGIALMEREWKKATQLFERVLNTDPENAEAYLGLMMTKAELSDQEAFIQAYINQQWRLYGLYGNNLRHAKEFAGAELGGWFASLDEKAKAERKRRETETKIEQERKKTMEQERDEPYKQVILSYLSATGLVVTSTDIKELLQFTYPDGLWGYQKAASLLNALCTEGKLIRVEEEKNSRNPVPSVFKLSETERRFPNEERAKMIDEEQARKIAFKAEQVETERKRLEEIARKKAALEAERDKLQAELANLKGLFTRRQRRKIESRLTEIDLALKC